MSDKFQSLFFIFSKCSLRYAFCPFLFKSQFNNLLFAFFSSRSSTEWEIKSNSNNNHRSINAMKCSEAPLINSKSFPRDILLYINFVSHFHRYSHPICSSISSPGYIDGKLIFFCSLSLHFTLHISSFSRAASGCNDALW